jgi:hypothetical protein
MAGIAAGATTVTAVVVGPAMASGAEGAYQQPVSAAVQHAAMTWHLPNVQWLRQLHRRSAHHARSRHAAARRHAAQHRASARGHAAAPSRPAGPPQVVAQALAARRGWDGAQWTCLDSLWNRESAWNPTAVNASSGAYGIPQALPARKLASAGADWRTNPVTQIRWGLHYIAVSYGTPCQAVSFWDAHGYY